MTRLLVLREQLKLLCSKYEIYLIPIGKFLTAMFTFLIINGNIGYMEKLAKFPLVIIMALLCSFLPLNFIIIMAAGLTLAHLYALSLECAAVVGILFLLMFLLYFCALRQKIRWQYCLHLFAVRGEFLMQFP